MKKKRYVRVDMLVLIFVVTLGMTVGLSRYWEAEISSTAAKAIRDLSMLADAIETYRMAEPGDGILYAQIEPAQEDLALLHALSTDSLYRLGPTWHQQSTFTFEHDFAPTLQRYLIEVPVPDPAYMLPHERYVRGRYHLATYAWREGMEHFYQNAPEGRVPPPEWQYFEQNPPSEFLGYGFGPVINTRLHDPEQAGERSGAFITFPDYYVPYDPTNGVWSHGFAVYRSKQRAGKGFADLQPPDDVIADATPSRP